ncbi:CARDB domain protein [Leptospira stimsonii]|uniref:CARDB domain protein n=1 Tax=Leptospira stimsonii TaxID=2202203 RepID=A0A396YSW6_9LEPT|nr:CARDB domain protein [Leptospira stimsonii]RHX85665.1 CARDB domain protein [Leptospira stimsonii]
MQIFRNKIGKGSVILALIWLFFSCGNRKEDGDTSSLLLLLLKSGTHADGTVTSEFSGGPLSSESNSVSQSGSDLIIVNPFLTTYVDDNDKSKCEVYFAFKVKNIGNETLKLRPSHLISANYTANLKQSQGGSFTLKNLAPGETQDVSFLLNFPIHNIEDENKEFKIRGSLIVGGNELRTDNNFISLSTMDCAQEMKAGPADLLVSVSGVTNVLPGEDLSQNLSVKVVNIGNAVAKGSNPSQDGYMVDLILSKDTDVPEGYAPYSPVYKEDALLSGGRISNTPNLTPGAHAWVSEGSVWIPKDIPFGKYFLCARIDPGSKVQEAMKGNNTSCTQINVGSIDKADLIIPRASIYPSGMKCSSGKPILFVTAEVKNIGKVSSSEALHVGLLNALDTNGEVWGAGNGVWGNGIGLEAIQPEQTLTVTFPIYYLAKDPLYMEGAHSFDLRVNRGNWIQESDTSNNGYKNLLKISIPEGYCKNHPG